MFLEKKIACNLCQKTYKHRQSLMKHRLVKHAQRCDICDGIIAPWKQGTHKCSQVGTNNSFQTTKILVG